MELTVLKTSTFLGKSWRLAASPLALAVILAAASTAANATVIASAGRSCDASTTQSASSNTSTVSVFSMGGSGQATGLASPGFALAGSGIASDSGLGCGWGGGGYDQEFLVVTGLAPGEVIPVTAYVFAVVQLEAVTLNDSSFAAANVAFAAGSQDGTISRDEFLDNTGTETLHFTTHLGEAISRDILLPMNLGPTGQFLQVQASAGASATINAHASASIAIGGSGGDLAQFFVPDDYVYTGPGNFSDIRVTVGAAGPARVYRYSELFGAVPEPSTWAMMICGFALAGAGLRRRAAAVAAS